VVQPEVHFSPKGLWVTGEKSWIEAVILVQRPGHGHPHYLLDQDIPWQGMPVSMSARVFFLDSRGHPLAEPLETPFLRDC
jgi:hypothetical protein